MKFRPILLTLAQVAGTDMKTTLDHFEPEIVFLMHGHNGGQTAADHRATYSKLWTNVATIATNCSISSMALTLHGGGFKRLDARLPWAIDEAELANAGALNPEIAGWQDSSIRIRRFGRGDRDCASTGMILRGCPYPEWEYLSRNGLSLLP